MSFCVAARVVSMILGDLLSKARRNGTRSASTWSSLRPPEEARGGVAAEPGVTGGSAVGSPGVAAPAGVASSDGAENAASSPAAPAALRGVEAGATKSPTSSAATSSLVALMSSPWRRADAHERIFSRLSPTTSLTLVIASAEVARWQLLRQSDESRAWTEDARRVLPVRARPGALGGFTCS